LKKWLTAIIFLLLFVSGFGQIDKTLLEEQYWYIYFPCINDSSVIFSDSIIISIKPSDNLLSLCNQTGIRYFDFIDSSHVILNHSAKVDTTQLNHNPPYTSFSIMTRNSEMNCTWKVIQNQWLIIKPENSSTSLVYDVVQKKDEIILHLRKSY